MAACWRSVLTSRAQKKDKIGLVQGLDPTELNELDTWISFLSFSFFQIQIMELN